MNDFYSRLRAKLSRQPSAVSDHTFWSRFDSEFGNSRRGKRWFWILAPGGLVAALVMTFSLTTVERSPVMDAPELAEHELLEDYELLADLEDIEFTEENVDFLVEGS